MKTALSCSLLLLACAAHAQQTISVTGDAEIKVVPNQVVLSLGVEVHAKALADARQDNDRRVRNIRAAATRAGIDPKDIQTDFIQLGMEYENDGVTPRYYYSRKSIVITLRDIERMEETLAATVDAGATHIHGVNFETTELRKYRDQARALAVKAATEKARDMAAAAGLKVGEKPVGISSQSFGGRSWYGNGWYGGRGGMSAQNVSVAMDGTGGGGSEGTVALGRISVTASVSLTFRVE
jgi:uncharacterized protein YggE